MRIRSHDLDENEQSFAFDSLVRKKLLFFVTEDWFFCSHFLDRAVVARKAGYDVTVLTRVDKHASTIARHGLKVIPLEIRRRSANPLREFATLRAIINVYHKERPDIVHHVALKPILYGTFAARRTGVRLVVNAPVGLGYMFVSRHLMAQAFRPLVMKVYKHLMNPPGSAVVCENPDDLAMFIEHGIVNQRRAVLIKGAGVDLARFRPSPEPSGRPIVMLASRMLWDKGVGEFVEAAGYLRGADVNARFVLVGDSDPHNPSAVPVKQLERWQRDGIVEWWGKREDMPSILAQAQIVCLPSYREGLPKILIEAAACGRAIVTTDVPGCREVVCNGDNGLLVPHHDASALAQALKTLLENADLRQRMGARGRLRAEREFGSDAVSQQTLALYADNRYATF